MKKSITAVFLLLLLLHTSSAGAQAKTITINGKVTSFEESLPLEAVSVTVKGTGNNTGTQADGTFSLSVTPGEKLLVLSLPGYEKKEIPITNATEYDIVLKRAVEFVYVKTTGR